jgi:hypothetical protein
MGLADKLFPGEKEYGIPTLSLDYQATDVPYPFVKWAEISGKREMRGTWHFYAYDGKLQNLWYNPHQLLSSNATAFVEINWSIRNVHPKAYALGQIYRKRQVSRWLQSKGKKIFVDMNVGGTWRSENLLGVPEGWKAYCTRGYTEKIMYISEQIGMAVDRAGTEDILFVVYGGGEIVADCCKEADCVHIPERLQAIRTGGDGLPPKVDYEEYKDVKKTL